MFEATPAPKNWVARNLQHDRVIVPTDSSRKAWIAGGMPEERICICPLGVNPRIFSSGTEPLPLQLPGGEPASQYRVRFLNISELGPRKNIAGLLRAWIKATTPADDAILMLKLGHYEEEECRSFRSEMEALRTDSGKALADAAPVLWLYDLYSDGEMPRLYRAATHYFSMSFGEGWDQATMEAAACGLRLIVPNHSAYTSYLDSSVASLISSREIPVNWSGDAPTSALFENARWWEPDEDEAAAYIRSAIDRRDVGGPIAQSRVLKSFTWEMAVHRLTEILSEFDPPRKRFWPFSAASAVPARQD
jgi:glycosyltransferase involved in cell wall biosynthesis